MIYRPNPFVLSLVVLAFLPACSGDVSLGRNDGNVNVGGAGGSADAAGGAGGVANTESPDGGGAQCAGDLVLEELISGVQALNAGDEGILCVRKTVDAMDISSVHSTGTIGLHDLAVSVGPRSGPDGEAACTATESQPRILFTATTLEFAQDFAPPFHVDSGEQILLRFDAVDVTDHPIRPSVSVGITRAVDCAPPALLTLHAPWTADAGQEEDVCTRKTVNEDLEYSSLELEGSPGTSSVVSYGAPSGPDGTAPCAAGDINAVTLASSGEGSQAFPGGVVPATQQILLHARGANSGALRLTGVGAAIFR